jgi:hypothetical protein
VRIEVHLGKGDNLARGQDSPWYIAKNLECYHWGKTWQDIVLADIYLGEHEVRGIRKCKSVQRDVFPFVPNTVLRSLLR